jgi:aldehyde dehydrogenase (NAD+)
LGGKSPTVVDSSANLTVAARRIVQGKFVNCGATCIAPDYILVESKVKAALTEKLKKQVEIFYSNDPQTSSDYGRVLNSVHLERLQGMVDDAVKSGAKVECGGTQVVEDRFMAPTILSDVRPDCAVMKEEIFGPVLPVLEVGSVDEAVDFIKSRPKPLASYIFSSKNRSIKKIRDGVSSGSMCVNDATVQVLSPDIPFGGVGPSGMGAYHGREGFLLFSHSKSVYDHDTITDGLTFMRYPPFTGFKKGILGMVLGKSW